MPSTEKNLKLCELKNKKQQQNQNWQVYEPFLNKISRYAQIYQLPAILKLQFDRKQQGGVAWETWQRED